MLDNLNLIKPLLKWENEDQFYMVQIIQRRKDWNPAEPNQHRVIKEYYFYSMEQIERRYEEIKNLCNIFNARAYIRLSRRDARDIAKKMIIELWEAFKNDSFKHLRKIYSTVVGRDKWLDKYWIIDIDEPIHEKDFNRIDEVLDYLHPTGKKIVAEIPTRNWLHLITKPFNRQWFSVLYKYDIHTNNPTVLYSS